MELFLDSLYKGWNKTLKKLLCAYGDNPVGSDRVYRHQDSGNRLINVEVLMIEKDYDLNDIVEMKRNIHVINQKIGRLYVWGQIFALNVWAVVQVCCFPECSLKRN